MPDQPIRLAGASKDPEIYTIPEQFYGLAAKAQLSKESAAPAAQAPSAAPQEKGSKAWILIPVIALLLVFGLGFGAWYLLKPKPAPAPTRPSVTLPTTPAPQPRPEPQSEQEPAPPPESTTTTPEVPAAPSPSADEDGDGLTTVEEALFRTDAKKSDSDEDGFSDSVEVTNLYNPAGFRPTKLIEAGQVKTYASDAGFELLMPASSVAGRGVAETVLDVELEGDEVFAVWRRENPEGKSPLDWYLSRNPDASPSEAQVFTTKSGLEGVRTPDGDTAYIALGGKIYELRHGGVARVMFRTTFVMFVNSFSAKP
ncbi:MAG: hypothetical protein AAB554_05800 [Patescibacteria group bacterium]